MFANLKDRLSLIMSSLDIDTGDSSDYYFLGEKNRIHYWEDAIKFGRLLGASRRAGERQAVQQHN